MAVLLLFVGLIVISAFSKYTAGTKVEFIKIDTGGNPVNDKTEIARKKLLDGDPLSAEDKVALSESWRKNSDTRRVLFWIAMTIGAGALSTIGAKFGGLI